MKHLISTLVFSLLLLAQPCFAEAPAVTFEGGDGSSFEKAILIKHATEGTGVKSEYRYIEQHFPGSKVGMQALQNNNKRMYDVLTIQTSEGEKKVYFDITEFFGKF